MSSTVSRVVKDDQTRAPAASEQHDAAETADPATGTLLKLLRDTIRRHPDRTSVQDPMTGETITYRELGTRAGTLRDALARHGVEFGDRVGICAPKSIATVAAIFGILEARAAYVPVDAGAPPQRNAGIFEDCAASAIIVAKSLVERLRAVTQASTLDTLEELGDDLVLIRGFETPRPTVCPAKR